MRHWVPAVLLLLSLPAAAAVNCGAIPVNATVDDIQGCLNAGGTVRLTAGATYVLSRTLILSVNNTIFRTTVNGQQATLQRLPNVGTPQVLFAVANRTGFRIYDITFDGNKAGWNLAKRQLICGNDGLRPGMYNITIHGDSRDFTLSNIVSANAPCGTGLEMEGTNFTIENSAFRNNGTNDGPADTRKMWADGLTAVRCTGGHIVGNRMTDNTDIDLIVGGGNCTVETNTIQHVSQWSFGGLMLHYFPAGGGNHTGAVYRNNTILAGGRILFGIMVGDHPWRSDCTSPSSCSIKVYGGSVTGNTVRNAFINLAVDGVRGVQIANNSLSSPAGNDVADALLPNCRVSIPGSNGFYAQNYTAAHVASSCIPMGYAQWSYEVGNCQRQSGTVQMNCTAPCTSDANCNGDFCCNGVCRECCVSSQCNDGDPCTMDSCVGGICKNDLKPGCQPP